jgi:hypothetical protein
MRHILTFILFAALAGAARGETITAARYAEPTTRYDHGILGDAVEWGALRLWLDSGETRLLRLPDTRVFEDIAPRLLRDGAQSYAMVVETDLARGARLALYGPDGLYAATPFIGQTHRWLAPVAAGDLDGDGALELAYVDRPHLAKTLRVWRLAGGALAEIAALEGVTNHRIGWDFIAGGLRDCGFGPEMVLASGDWREVVAVRLAGGRLVQDSLGPLTGLADLDAALACR